MSLERFTNPGEHFISYIFSFSEFCHASSADAGLFLELCLVQIEVDKEFAKRFVGSSQTRVWVGDGMAVGGRGRDTSTMDVVTVSTRKASTWLTIFTTADLTTFCGLEALVIDHLSVWRIAGCLKVAWHTANTAVLATGHHLLINDPTRFDGVRVSKWPPPTDSPAT